jgi:hypothetical protein
MEMTDIEDPRDFNRVRDELEALGLGVDHDGRGAGTRTTYDLGPLLAEARQASENRRFHSRRSPSLIDGSPAVVIDGSPATETTAPEPPRMETSSRYGARRATSMEPEVKVEEANDSSSPRGGSTTELRPTATEDETLANGDARVYGSQLPWS